VIVVTLACAAPVPDSAVLPGIDVLLTDSSHLIDGRRVGLVANAAVVDRGGTGTLERLLADSVQVTAIFSPEHGYRVQREGDIGDAVDSATGLPVYSLYGTRRRPSAEALEQVDVVLVDLPDIGGRTYTYTSTMLGTMEAAGDAGVSVVILDRPNPIGGVLVQGALLDPGYASFVGRLPVPARHGMTLGELALFGAATLGLTGDVTVVPALGWSRNMWFDATGLPWVNPSPSMPGLESATHYPGLVVFEATSVSVGRGTPIAFQVLGAPWLDPARVLDRIGVLPGVDLRDTVVTPTAPPDGKFDGESLPSIRLHVRDRAIYDPVATGVELLFAIEQAHPGMAAPDSGGFARLWGSAGLWNALRSGANASAVAAAWSEDVARFREVRAPFLLYD
jgi:uncharacterized protein YbbC (DUF1343 family)